MLIEADGEEWIAKFPRGSNVDQFLVEHACMELGRRAGLDVASSHILPGGVDHILMVRRFDGAHSCGFGAHDGMPPLIASRCSKKN
jgi:serine/threonine-protein kinase HipA